MLSALKLYMRQISDEGGVVSVIVYFLLNAGNGFPKAAAES